MTGFTGAFWRNGDTGFDDAAASRLFNHRRPSRRPAVVLRAAHAADVAAGVRLAAAEGWKVAVRSGGHSWAAWSLREDTLLIDLALFTRMSYDPDSATVAVGPAVRGGLDLDPYLAGYGRFFAVGHAPTVGMGGFLLQGGIGWNCRGWGWAAESIESMDVVTADGELVRCSETDNPDLFWAARGSGPGFFGVVTEFRLRTRPRFRELTQSTYVYPVWLAPEVLNWYHMARHDLPSSVELAAVGCTPPGSGSPVLIVDAVSFDGGPVSLAALGTCPVAGKALTANVAQQVDFADLQAAQLRSSPEYHRYFADNAFLAGSASELVPALVPAFTDLPTPKTFTVLGDFTPLLCRRPPDMSLSVQTDLYFAAYVIGETPEEDAWCRSWLDAAMERVAPYSAGCYLGDSDLTVRPDRVMSDAAWSEFQRIRTARDPEGRFPGYLGAPVQ
ncbi:FAD/FMN-containing dehydrogenase [Streptomyces griseochromogenes]|uniref:FAD-binding oxidoreductase n=1 Tax=Streptomyces griseochromogenes TaxID=68214 RepID=A0A1B1AZP2_9ACTN|nr:FAD-binding oxidoreductase [Streptomyces griseochromogenes]ANP52053.1 FAD-binding oxidoreductase [Streptomyces griseochromogenes]MBP2056267.1 FAD/FMN-containing dehydrogenase [Streptomyces griseochromogenes]